MKLHSCKSISLIKALIATALLALGYNQAAARIDPVLQHKGPAIADPVVAELPGAWCVIPPN
jgi:hypothetical protein